MNTALAGVALQLAALAVFVLMDTLIKLMTVQFSVPQLMWARFAFSFATVAAFLWATTGSLPWRSRAPWLQTLRSLLLCACSLLFSTALSYIPLADATAVGFASPLFTVALAAMLLREKVGWRRWAGVAIGLCGVVIVLRPPFLIGGEAPHWATLLPLGTAVLFAFYQILTRRLAALDDPRTTILHTAFAASLVVSLVQPFVWVWPSGGQWAVLALLGALGGVGHGMLVLAYARAPASLLAPISYSQLAWAILASLVVFGDRPDLVTLAGMGVIATGGVLVALPAQRRGTS